MMSVLISVISVFSHDVSHESFQHAFGPVRIYYRLMKVWYGGKKSVFETGMKDGVHPLIVYYKRYSGMIRTVTLLSEQLIPSICLLLLLVTCQTASNHLYRWMHVKYD